MLTKDIKLLEKLCQLHGPSGNEMEVKIFILNYVKKNCTQWAVKPTLYYGDEFQDCVILEFGNPRTIILAHMDTVGFTVRYNNQLIPIGGPEIENGFELVGKDSLGPIECKLVVDKENHLAYNFNRGIEKGTGLVFKSQLKETGKYIQSAYLDNRLGIYSALKVAETLKNGIIAFSCWEEHGGGSVPLLMKFIYEKHTIKQALICDITWVTDGIKPGKGVVISMRDRNIPRSSYLTKIIGIAEKYGINYQLEVESRGSSDGREIQLSPYPIDWCFIGAPEQNVHSPNETVHKEDIENMINLYVLLMLKL